MTLMTRSTNRRGTRFKPPLHSGHTGRSVWAWGGRDLPEDPVVRIPIGLVAHARCGLEASPVEHGDIAAAVMDEVALLQSARRFGDAHSADAKHQGQEFLRYMKCARVRAILGHQQPAGEAGFAH